MTQPTTPIALKEARWRYFDLLTGMLERELTENNYATSQLVELLDRVERMVTVIDETDSK